MSAKGGAHWFVLFTARVLLALLVAALHRTPGSGVALACPITARGNWLSLRSAPRKFHAADHQGRSQCPDDHERAKSH
jgi:hypothetical protein